MRVDSKQAIAQLDDLLAGFEIIRSHQAEAEEGSYSYWYYDVPRSDIIQFIARAHAAISRLSSPESIYTKSLPILDRSVSEHGLSDVSDYYAGLLKALKADYVGGFLESVVSLIQADVFNDFLEMALHLFEQGYKDPAAVITGSVLEEHLRKLCDKNVIPVLQPDSRPKKADTLNAELAGVGVYSKLDQKNVTAWLDLRNKAAHGKYTEYTKEQVALLIQSVRDFITRNPA